MTESAADEHLRFLGIILLQLRFVKPLYFGTHYMRIRNKELRQRWHRKEQRVKELIAEAKKNKAEGGAKAKAPKPEKPPVEKKVAEKKVAAPKKPKAEAAVPAAEKPVAEKPVAEKAKKAPAKKKPEAPAAE